MPSMDTSLQWYLAALRSAEMALARVAELVDESADMKRVALLLSHRLRLVEMVSEMQRATEKP